MSTDEGHSLLQLLHDRQRSSALCTALSVKVFRVLPESASNKIRARPRVECISSRVAMYDGHMVPASVLRHLPIPAHLSTAPASPSSARKSKCVSTGRGRYADPCLRCESSGRGSTRLPGLSILP